MNHTQDISLNGAWELTYGPQRMPEPKDAPEPDWPTISATVPGNAELDLMAAGVIEDPTVGNRVYELRKYETYEWWYRRTFPTPEFDEGQRIGLVFDGLDCLGTIWINGQLVGRTDNMLVSHRFDVTGLLEKDGDNEVVVRVASAALEGRKHDVPPYEFVHGDGEGYDSLTIRRAPHLSGWDIMPRMVTAGLWRDVSLVIVNPTRWRSICWTTSSVDAAERTAIVFLDWDFVTDLHDVDSLSVRVALAQGDRTLHTSEHPVLTTHGRVKLCLANVDLWWPRGHGEPALHDATVELLDATGNTLDVHRCRVGIRTVELRRTDLSTLEEPGEFVFVVNGEKVFVKGTNWVPLDSCHSRDPEHLEDVFAMAVDLNCNMLRCWGGNVYEDHGFFDLCDENGVLVWQDFAFACMIYPQTDEFCAKVRQEAESVVKKLRNHASIAVWAGNNEIDMAFQWDRGLNLDPNTERISREILPQVCRLLDPMRPYLPSSPYRSPEAMKRDGGFDVMPEVHLWSNRPHFKDAFYTAQPAQFVSEIGYHGCPERASLEQFLDPGHVWPWCDEDGVPDDQWLTKAARPLPSSTATNYRIPLMAKQITLLFDRVPDTLDDFVLASQIVQGEANKFFVEWWRQGKWRRTGILWWNLRDGWTIFSDSVVDYFNRKKLAYW